MCWSTYPSSTCLRVMGCVRVRSRGPGTPGRRGLGPRPMDAREKTPYRYATAPGPVIGAALQAGSTSTETWLVAVVAEVDIDSGLVTADTVYVKNMTAVDGEWQSCGTYTYPASDEEENPDGVIKTGVPAHVFFDRDGKKAQSCKTAKVVFDSGGGSTTSNYPWVRVEYVVDAPDGSATFTEFPVDGTYEVEFTGGRTTDFLGLAADYRASDGSLVIAGINAFDELTEESFCSSTTVLKHRLRTNLGLDMEILNYFFFYSVPPNEQGSCTGAPDGYDLRVTVKQIHYLDLRNDVIVYLDATVTGGLESYVASGQMVILNYASSDVSSSTTIPNAISTDYGTEIRLSDGPADLGNSFAANSAGRAIAAASVNTDSGPVEANVMLPPGNLNSLGGGPVGR